jgi:hypothetical protein
MLAVQMNWELFNRYTDVMTPSTLLGVMVAVAVAAWMIVRMRSRFREDSGRADDKLELLSQFRELRLQGELSEDEFRLIKSRLARDAAVKLAATPGGTRNSAKPAEEFVRREGGSEKTGETGRDDANLPESRSSEEPPNENSTTVDP